jgi:hypothetical protein
VTFQEWAAVVGVSGIVGAAASAGLGLLRDKTFLGVQSKHEQRKKLRDLIGEYHGRVLEAALDWDRRMGQLYDRTQEDEPRWHELAPRTPGKQFDPDQYVYQSYVFRFLSLMSLARRFEAEAFYINCEVASERDFDFLRYMKGFLWAGIHPRITPDDGPHGEDHFRSDSFRPVLDYCYAKGKGLPETLGKNDQVVFDWARFQAIVGRLREPEAGEASAASVPREFTEVFAFFDGLSADECERRRWDRLVALHLFVMGFIATFGYSWQRGELRKKTDRAVSKVRYRAELLDVFAKWLPRLGFEKRTSRIRGRSAHNTMRVISSALEEAVQADQGKVGAPG